MPEDREAVTHALALLTLYAKFLPGVNALFHLYLQPTGDGPQAVLNLAEAWPASVDHLGLLKDLGDRMAREPGPPPPPEWHGFGLISGGLPYLATITNEQFGTYDDESEGGALASAAGYLKHGPVPILLCRMVKIVSTSR